MQFRPLILSILLALSLLAVSSPVEVLAESQPTRLADNRSVTRNAKGKTEKKTAPGKKAFRKPAPKEAAGAVKKAPTAETKTAEMFQAQPGHTYYFRVRAMDEMGNWEEWPPGDGAYH